MKVVVAIDSLKGSLTSMEAGEAIKEGILKATDAQVIVKSLADGGEGTAEALIQGLGGERLQAEVCGPYEKKVIASYGYLKETNTAIMEMAAAAGIILAPGGEMNPLNATTYGVGEMIKDAIHRGCRSFIIGIGGSATNDGGLGMLSALGFEFFDQDGKKVGITGSDLGKIKKICRDNVLPELAKCNFQIACDVNNPLCGKNGATYVYGPQKGLKEELMEALDKDMENYARVTKEYMNNDYKEIEGAGAAGGLGFAFLSYLGAKLEPGFEIVLKAINLEESIRDADFVITGEGKLDHQTAMGKAPAGVAALAKKCGAVVIALAGSVTKEAGICNENGIDAYFSILTQVVTLQEAMNAQVAKDNMTRTAEQIFRLICTVNPGYCDHPESSQTG